MSHSVLRCTQKQPNSSIQPVICGTRRPQISADGEYQCGHRSDSGGLRINPTDVTAAYCRGLTLREGLYETSHGVSSLLLAIGFSYVAVLGDESQPRAIVFVQASDSWKIDSSVGARRSCSGTSQITVEESRGRTI